MEKSNTTSPRSDHVRSEGPEHQRSLPFQFVTEHGRRPQSNSAVMSAARSHARKHAALERQRQNDSSKGRLKVRPRSLQIAPDPAHVEDLATRLDTGPFPIKLDGDNVESAGLPIHIVASQDAMGIRPIFYKHSQQTKFPRSRARMMETGEVETYKEARMRPPSGNILRVGRLLDFQHRQPISPQTILGAGRVDPFQSYPVKAEPYVNVLVDYYVLACRKNVAAAQAEKGAPVTAFSRLVTEWLPLCMTNAIAFKSVLVLPEFSFKIAIGENPRSLCANQLLMECMALLRKEIDNPNREVTDAMIATVVNIAFSELASLDLSKFDSHKRGLDQMLNLRGGVDKLDGILKFLVIWLNQLGEEVKRRAQDAHDRGKRFSIPEKKVAQTTAVTAQAEGLLPPSYDQHIVTRRLKSFVAQEALQLNEELLVLKEGVQ